MDRTRPDDPAGEDDLVIDLRDRNVAALLAWAWPGAGHLYQRRWAKGIVFMVCILGTFVAGMYLGEGKVVYAAWGPQPEQRRLYYVLQVGVGLPAAPALVQAMFDRPLGDFMAPPVIPPRGERFHANDKEYLDEQSMWNLEIDLFEIGTIYTVIAGLLNVLVIFDAYGGPVISRPRPKPKWTDSWRRYFSGEPVASPKSDQQNKPDSA